MWHATRKVTIWQKAFYEFIILLKVCPDMQTTYTRNFEMGKQRRKPRVILFEDNALVLNALETFFRLRGYEVLSYTEPAVCPLYERCTDRCDTLSPCTDIVISDLRMPGMTGIELLQRQSERGCKVDVRNKAIMSAYLSKKYEEIIRDLGFAFFHKAYILRELPDWLSEREKYFDLS